VKHPMCWLMAVLGKHSMYLERTNDAWRKHLCFLVYGSTWKTPFMFKDDSESLENTCCAHWFMVVLG